MSRHRGNRRSPSTPAKGGARRTVPEQETAPAWPAPAAQSIAWARRRGGVDREAGRLCRQYKAFLTRYGLTDSVLAKLMWKEYESARAAVTGPREPAVPAHAGIPREWYEDAVKSLGAKAEIQEDGASVVVVLKVGGQVVGQYPEPRGRRAASRDVARFNKHVAERKVNPPDALVDAWR